MQLLPSVRLASSEDAEVVATMLDDFNREFDTPTPGIDVLVQRLTSLIERDDLFVLLAEDPVVGLALVTMRPSVWYSGRVATLDELYVQPARRNEGLGTAILRAVERTATRQGCSVIEINVDGDDADAMRFYERHGYVNIEPGQSTPMTFYYRELVDQD